MEIASSTSQEDMTRLKVLMRDQSENHVVLSEHFVAAEEDDRVCSIVRCPPRHHLVICDILVDDCPCHESM